MPTTNYDTNQAAEWANLSPRTLERMRIEGRGPTYRKHGRRVIYAESDLIAWSENQKRISTSDTGCTS